MSKLAWIVGGTTLALAVYVTKKQGAGQPVPANGVDAAASNIGNWGTKQQAFGTGGELKGKLEQGAGSLTGNTDLGNKGALDQAKGAVKNAAGQAAHAVEQTVHELNK
ncbi:MAG: CsbD family protein [Janthinobacterium lividum]